MRGPGSQPRCCITARPTSASCVRARSSASARWLWATASRTCSSRARAAARAPYDEGRPRPKHANDPNELEMLYSLYRMPFNGGKGGEPVPVEGASHNGMSNNFPKVSPDGRWIVFVEEDRQGDIWLLEATEDSF